MVVAPESVVVAVVVTVGMMSADFLWHCHCSAAAMLRDSSDRSMRRREARQALGRAIRRKLGYASEPSLAAVLNLDTENSCVYTLEY